MIQQREGRKKPLTAWTKDVFLAYKVRRLCFIFVSYCMCVFSVFMPCIHLLSLRFPLSLIGVLCTLYVQLFWRQMLHANGVNIGPFICIRLSSRWSCLAYFKRRSVSQKPSAN